MGCMIITPHSIVSPGWPGSVGSDLLNRFPDALHNWQFQKLLYFRRTANFSLANSVTSLRNSASWATTSSSLVVPFSANQPAITAGKGLYSLEAQTNSVPNPSMSGAVVGVIGSGGSLPTGWSNQGVTGIPLEVVSIGSSYGMNYIDVRWSGTNSTGATQYPGLFITQGGTSGVPATSSQTWFAGIYVQLVAGSVAGYVNIFQGWNVFGATGNYLATDAGNFTPDNTFKFYSQDQAPSNASTAYLGQILSGGVNNGSSIDITLRIWAPQLIQTSIQTQPILDGSFTRLADNNTETQAATTTEAFAGAAHTANGSQTQQTLWQHGSNTDCLLLYRNASNVVKFKGIVGGVSQFDIGTTVVANNTDFRYAVSAETGAYGISIDGAAAETSATGTMPSGMTTLYQGHDATPANHWNANEYRREFFDKAIDLATYSALPVTA